MEYIHLVLAKIQEFQERHPSTTVGAMFYGAMHLKFKNKEFTKGNLFELEDDELYGLLSRALVVANQQEQDDQEEIEN